MPWVSRERLEEVQERLRISEEERKLLLDRISVLQGAPPIYTRPEPTPVVVAPVVPVVETPDEKKETYAGSVSFDVVHAEVQKAIKAGTTGLTKMRTNA